MAKRMQYCFYCGEELGILYDKSSDELDTCGKRECNRAARDAYGEREEEVKYRAEQDHYDRYR
jgi:hypothetical protein